MELLGVDSQIWIAHHEFVFDWQLWAPRLLNIVITLARVMPEMACEVVKPEVLECVRAYVGKAIVRLQQLAGSVELPPPTRLDVGVQVSDSYWPSSSQH